jgi:hypothetical protein
MVNLISCHINTLLWGIGGRCEYEIINDVKFFEMSLERAVRETITIYLSY